MKTAYIAIPIMLGIVLVISQAYAIGPGMIKEGYNEIEHNASHYTNMTMNQTNRTAMMMNHTAMRENEKRNEVEHHFWHEGHMGFKEKMQVMEQTRENWKHSYEKWAQAKEQCQAGNCSMYFNASKDMVLSAINASVTRLETVNTTTANELITNLTTMQAQIENTTNITQLRAIYPEVRSEISEANQIFERNLLINLAQTYTEYLNKLPQTPAVKNIETELNQTIENQTMSVEMMKHQLMTIRGQIIALG